MRSPELYKPSIGQGRVNKWLANLLIVKYTWSTIGFMFSRRPSSTEHTSMTIFGNIGLGRTVLTNHSTLKYIFAILLNRMAIFIWDGLLRNSFSSQRSTVDRGYGWSTQTRRVKRIVVPIEESCKGCLLNLFFFIWKFQLLLYIYIRCRKSENWNEECNFECDSYHPANHYLRIIPQYKTLIARCGRREVSNFSPLKIQTIFWPLPLNFGAIGMCHANSRIRRGDDNGL